MTEIREWVLRHDTWIAIVIGLLALRAVEALTGLPVGVGLVAAVAIGLAARTCFP